MADWQVGDLALCVRGGPLPGGVPHFAFPRSGQVVLVELVERWPTLQSPFGTTLIFSEDLPENIGGSRCWAASRFIKVTPPEADAFDREVIEQMRGEPVEALTLKRGMELIKKENMK